MPLTQDDEPEIAPGAAEVLQAATRMLAGVALRTKVRFTAASAGRTAAPAVAAVGGGPLHLGEADG
jgi:hypothetical protein